MAKSPRNLRLLQIEDEPGTLIFEDAVKKEVRVAPFIDPMPVPGVGFDQISINGWASALSFWTRFPFTRENFPDLITSDVRFRDTTSPLQTLCTDNDFGIPTGLSHFKPLAAIARMAGIPVGYALHTRQPGGWNCSHEETEWRAMALLAAHEAAELAAILGDLPLNEGQQAQLEAGLRWLSRVGAESIDFDDAWPLALRRYRERLIQSLEAGQILVMPKDWLQLNNWCARMAAQPAALNNDTDIGFRFVTPDGKEDTISFRSLFADVTQFQGGDFSIEHEALPPSSFELALGTRSTPKDAAELDSGGFPKIGALVHAARRGRDIYDEALGYLRDFPIMQCASDVPLHLHDLAEGQTYGDAARALALLLTLVRRDYQRWNAWRDTYQTIGWDTVAENFNGKHDPGISLAVHAQSLDRHLRSRFKDDEDFDVDEVIRGAPEEAAFQQKKTAKILLELLCGLGTVAEGDGYKCYVRTGEPLPRDKIPPIPPLGREEMTIMMGPILADENDMSFLFAVFGFESNELGRLVYDGFGLTGVGPNRRAKFGRDYLKMCIDNGAPAWIKRLLIEYATALNWPREEWPIMLR